MKAQRSTRPGQYSRAVLSSATLLTLSLLSSCVETELNLVPGLPTAMDDAETRDVMQELAVSISNIEDAGISYDTLDSESERDIIVAELNRISGLISELEREDVLENTEQFDGNHEYVLDYLNTLASEVELAKAQAGDDDADLFIAGQLAGACRGCHEKLWPDS